MIADKDKLIDILGEFSAEAILSPEWENKGRVHDWRNYIPKALQGIWGDLSYDAQVIAYYLADGMAGREEW